MEIVSFNSHKTQTSFEAKTIKITYQSHNNRLRPIFPFKVMRGIFFLDMTNSIISLVLGK